MSWLFRPRLSMRSVQSLVKMIHSGHGGSGSVGMLVQAKANVSGVTINYDKTGKGNHPVLCLPGAAGFIESDFGPILPKFNQDKFTLITWDPPGFGKSRPHDRDFSGGPKVFVRDAERANEMMNILGYKEYSILGWSNGGTTGLLMAIKFPSAVKRLVLFGALAYVTEAEIKLHSQVENIDSWSTKMKAPMIEMYGEEYFKQIWTSSISLFKGIYKEGGDLCKNTVKDIKCPTLIIHGMKDAMVSFEHPQYLHETISNSELHLIAEGCHNVHLRHADKFVPLVQNFLLK